MIKTWRTGASNTLSGLLFYLLLKISFGEQCLQPGGNLFFFFIIQEASSFMHNTPDLLCIVFTCHVIPSMEFFLYQAL